MKLDRRRVSLGKICLALSLILYWIMFGFGCASVSDVMEKTKELVIPTPSSGKALKKKVGFTAFQNISEMNDEAVARHLETLLAQVLTSSCSGLIVAEAGDTENQPIMVDLPMGEVNDYLLSEEGRRSGLNAVLAATIVGVRREETKEGFIWFKESRILAEIIIRVDVYDTVTGAKAIFQNFTRKAELTEGDIAIFDDGKILEIESVVNGMGQIAKDISKAVCKTLEKENWRGFVISSDEEKVVISSGSDVGIKTGDKFNVYEQHGVVAGIEGHQYRIPGIMTDEIEITSVSPDRSHGISVSGGKIAPGSFVEIKEK